MLNVEPKKEGIWVIVCPKKILKLFDSDTLNEIAYYLKPNKIMTENQTHM